MYHAIEFSSKASSGKIPCIMSKENQTPGSIGEAWKENATDSKVQGNTITHPNDGNLIVTGTETAAPTTYAKQTKLEETRRFSDHSSELLSQKRLVAFPAAVRASRNSATSKNSSVQSTTPANQAEEQQARRSDRRSSDLLSQAKRLVAFPAAVRASRNSVTAKQTESEEQQGRTKGRTSELLSQAKRDVAFPAVVREARNSVRTATIPTNQTRSQELQRRTNGRNSELLSEAKRDVAFPAAVRDKRSSVKSERLAREPIAVPSPHFVQINPEEGQFHGQAKREHIAHASALATATNATYVSGRRSLMEPPNLHRPHLLSHNGYGGDDAVDNGSLLPLDVQNPLQSTGGQDHDNLTGEENDRLERGPSLDSATNNHYSAHVSSNRPNDYQQPQQVQQQELAIAHLIQEDSHLELPEAQQVDLSQQDLLHIQRKKQRLWACIGASVMAVCVLVVLLVATVTLTRGNREPTVIHMSPHIDETISPTMAPTLSWRAELLNLLPQYSVRVITDDDTSPQARAFQWLLNDPFVEEYPSWRIVQRFALATFYYSTDGQNWFNNENWTSYEVHECNWYYRYYQIFEATEADEPGVDSTPQDYWPGRPWLACQTDDSTTNVSSNNIINDTSGSTNKEAYKWLFLDATGLSGTIPKEISLLSSLISIRLSANFLQGSLPTEIGVLTDLQGDVVFTSNELTGELPREIGQLSKLQVGLGLGRNLMHGSLPTELGLLTNLISFEASDNAFGGHLLRKSGR